MTKVVITGMGVCSPLGNSVAEYWDGLCAGRSGVRMIDTFATDKFATKFAALCPDVAPEGMSGKDMGRQSRAILLALEAADQAWKQSGLDIDKEDPYRCGAVVGSGIGGIDAIIEASIRLHGGGPRRVSPMMIPKGLANMPSGNVAIRLGLKGPNRAIVTACATGTQCIGDGAELIRRGLADVMVTGGSEATVIPFGIAGFNAMRALSTRNDDPQGASRPYDKDRDGFVMGEGAGVLVLESEEHAKARGAAILGEVLGMGETCDAYHAVAPTPDGSGAAAAMNAALRASKLNPDRVDYFNAHGTSTSLNDSSECVALRSVFGDAMPPVSSTKSMIGHLLGAAGAVEAIACVKTIETGVIHPNINYETPDPECDLNLVANEAREARVAKVMSNSLGFGGHNASILFAKYG